MMPMLVKIMRMKVGLKEGRGKESKRRSGGDQTTTTRIDLKEDIVEVLA